jgi:ABC-2 type transport system permease protein
MLRRIAAVIRREYLEHVRTRAFWISTLLVPVLMGALMFVPVWLAARGGGTFTVAVVDLSGRFFDPLQREVQRALAASEEKLTISLLAQPLGPDPDATREALKRRVQGRDFDGMLVLPASLPDGGQPEYVAPNVAAFKLLTVLERSVNNVMVADRLARAGLDPDQIGQLTRRVELRTFKLGARGEETSDSGQTFLLSYALVMIIYMTVLLYGVYVMRGVLEEKSSRIVEVIVSTIRPLELMLGKILGIGAVGLTQFLIWTGTLLALSAPGVVAALFGGPVAVPRVAVSLMVFFVVYFLLGFLLYGTLYAAIGAAFDSEQEAQNFQGMVAMLLVLPLILMMQIFNQPDGALAVVLSLIPFFTPMLMLLRMTLTQVPAVQLAASVVLMVAAILGTTWLAAKIYRVGILVHGAKPKLKELVRWVTEA